MSTIRRIARNVAKANMKKAGMVQICKGSRNVLDGKGGFIRVKGSWFADNWREWAKK